MIRNQIITGPKGNMRRVSQYNLPGGIGDSRSQWNKRTIRKLYTVSGKKSEYIVGCNTWTGGASRTSWAGGTSQASGTGRTDRANSTA